MKIIIIGSGLMGRAIAFDLSSFSRFNEIAIADKNEESLDSANIFLKNKDINFLNIDIENKKELKNQFYNFDIAISAVPYKYNLYLSKISIQTKTHFLDLGGNNDIVKSQRELFSEAKNNKVMIIPDCGLAPGMTSTITREIVEYFDKLDFVKIRVGGLPVNPKSPLNYQIVFSPNGLINEYVEDAIVLEKGKIIKKRSLTEIEDIYFQSPFGKMEAFLTSGGCSTLPYTYREKIDYLDYKTIRYPSHCEKFKTLIDLGMGDEIPIKIKNISIKPRDVLIHQLSKYLPKNERDVVLIKVFGRGDKNGDKYDIEYSMIDYFDELNNITSMMRTTAYPVSINAQMIEQGIISKYGVYCPEEIIPCVPFFREIEKRNINIEKKIKSIDG